MHMRRTAAAMVFVLLIAFVGRLESARLEILSAKVVGFATRIAHTYAPPGLRFVQATNIASASPIESDTYMKFQNAQDYPLAFTPYARTSFWNAPVSTRPALLPNSAAIVAAQFPGGINPTPVRSAEAGKYDYGHPRFFATPSDPLVHLQCTKYCGAPDNGGLPKATHIPPKARPAGGTDAHFDVVQPDGTEIDFWAVYGSPGSDPRWNAPHDIQARDWQTGDTISAANIANCGSFASGSGRFSVGPGATAAGFCTNGGIVTAAELLAGHIGHALFVGGQCAIGAQFPAANGASTQRCTSGIGPPLGGREWYDVPCAATRANGRLQTWEKAILCALNEYGGYFGDNGDGGANFTGGVAPLLESEEPWRDYNGAGYSSPFAPLAAQGWYNIRIPDALPGSAGNRWIGADRWNPPGVDFPAHMHWLAPCSAERAC